MEAPRIFNSVEAFLYLSYISTSMQSCLGELQTIPWLSWLGLCSDKNRQVCVFPNHVPKTEFTTGGLRSTCKNTWKMISGNRMHLISILSVMAKAVNSYICVIFLLFQLQELQANIFTLSLCGNGCRILSWKMNLTHFGIRIQHDKMWNRWDAVNTVQMHCIWELHICL